ncbi:antibiotic biosynthesis monooxygenase [Alphaproteobacteria bacterium]|nr:antibiotic biosynthesis monooxygenase [Alphaproteobacteria bacterium]
MAVGIFATLKIQAGKESEFEAAFAKNQEAVKASEPGCLLYTLCQDKTDSTLYFVMEQYADQAARDIHGQSDAVKATMGGLGGMLAGAPTLVEFKIVS